MKYLSELFYLILLVVLIGCVSQPRVNDVENGMNKREVIKIMGSPEAVVHEGSFETLQYRILANSVSNNEKGDKMFKSGEPHALKKQSSIVLPEETEDLNMPISIPYFIKLENGMVISKGSSR